MVTSWRSVHKKVFARTTIILSLLVCSLEIVEGFSITNSDDFSLLRIDEEQPVGTVIVTVTTDQPADDFELTGNNGGYFGINSTTGEIFIQKRIDREVLESTSLTATVTARKGSSTAIANLKCIVRDINDVTPSFPKRFYNVSISEKTSVGKVVDTVSAVDTDTGTNGQELVTYEIASENEDGSFLITQYTGEVKVSRELDYETKTQYTLNITAKDKPGLSNWTILEITVLDADDLPARFTEFMYKAEVSEDAPLRTSILQVVAFDLDKGINSTVTYGMDQVTNPSRLFVINNVTGMISLNGSLDRESVAKYSIRVLAFSSYPVTDHATVNIKVTDVNDNRPVFTQSVYEGTVMENLATGTSVLKVEASDKDQGINAELRYHINPDSDTSRFSMNHQTGVITTAAKLDREEKHLYNLTVVVEDMNGNATMGNVFNNTANVYVHVQDANDNAPVFTSALYNITINESIGVGAKVIQVEAKEPDVDQDIVYAIIGGNELSRFLIGRRSGIIYIRSAIDRDPPRNETAFTLQLMAIDDKNHLLNSTSTVRVVVDDINDNRPHCSQDQYRASVYENATEGTIVMSLVCSDVDTADNARLTYQLVSGADKKFAIHSTSGAVYIISALDYDNGNASYKLSLLVTDHGNPPLSREISMNIDVININDNSPVFKKTQYDFYVLEGDYSSLAVLIGKVEATDNDADVQGCPCGQLRYSIVNSTGVFSIDHMTGVISTSSLLDRETKSIYTLVVMATDQDPWKPLSNITTVIIHVADENDNSPIFDQVNYTVKVGEDKKPGYEIIKVSSSDRDSGRNGNISYSIVSGNTEEVFAIDEMTGQITTEGPLDYETINRYKLTVAASDGGASPRQTTVMVLIDVIDVNDNKPVCLNNGLTFKIRENLPAGQIVTKISVVDKDHGINQKIHYSLVSDSFDVNHETGDVNTTRSLDRENQSNYTLIVVAHNSNQSSMTVNCTVMVVVEDDNDNSPLFNTSSLSISVSESAAVGITLLRVTAVDKDEGYNSDIRYALMGDGTRFAVNETTGIITLISSLDRETSSHYTLQIVARDRGLPQSLSSMIHVSINVTDVNDNPPVFDQAIYSSSVQENAVNNTIVLTVSAEDRDEGLNKQLDYFITEGNVENAFFINTSGSIMTVTPLDRETKDRYELTITARDSGVPSMNSTVHAVITVLDVNDNAPNITNAPSQITIQENTPTGSLVYLLTADDEDLGLNSRVTYTGYAEPAGTFVINPSTGMITTVGTLDRETAQSYKFHAYATDQGNPPLNSSIVSFDIIISDLNDNNPVFNPVSYAVNISEDLAIATVVLRVNASEKDSGESGRILYKIEAGDAQEYFGIDNTTGVISSSKTLDRESIARFDLVISAKDHGSPARYGYGYVTIYITDTNDLPPVFLMSQYSSNIKENIVIGTAVTTVIATDGDIGPNSKIMYSIVDGEGMLDFNITTVEELDPVSKDTRFIGRLYSARNLDRESRASYNLTVVASDGVYNSTTHVIITVQDVNDNPPIFDVSSRVINISLAENTPGGTKILNVTARDNDEGSNARITYSVAGNDGHFYIDPNTGVLYTTPQTLDRETKDFYNLTITVSDPGNNKASITVNVNVLDVNDNPPQFNSSVVSVTIDEGSAVMIDVTATDQDQGANQEIEYSIISGNDGGIFQIDNKTGSLTSVEKLDRERLGLKLDQNGDGVYSLVVEAADQGRPKMSSKINVIVTVKDINDNAPIFQKPLYLFEIPENTSVGEVLGSVKADDKDIGNKGQVIYSIIPTGNGIPFVVNTSTGILSVNNSLDRELASSYEFTVQASDTGSPSLNGTATIKVVIKDINDNKPVFGQGAYRVAIPENTPGGSSVLKVEAQDPDEGNNGRIGYAILGGSHGHFIIEEWTGIIRTIGHLDYETNQSYTIDVSASDRGRPSRRNLVLVFINITDINDHAPVFNQSQYSVNISEDSPVNTSFLVVQAADLDQGINAKISFSMVDDFGVFSIQQDSGELSINRKLDREEKDSYQVQVKATDNGVPPMSSIALVKIIVTDVNDNAPTFSKPWFSFQTSEDALNGAILGLVTAVDRDIGDNARLNYTLTGGKDLFQIDSHTGSLSLVHSALGLANQNISLLVTCHDNGRPSLSSDVNVTVFISTGSRKVPKLVPRHLNVSIYENASIGDIVKLNASDTVQSNIDYLLLAGGYGKFFLNSTNGVLTLTGELDRETKSSYTLFVMIQDRTLPLYSNYGSVFIDILDINDNPPKFIQKPFGVRVSEDSANGSKVTQVEATDPDEGINGQVFYFLQGDSSSSFSINNRTGVVNTKTKLDYETIQSYNVTVIAENSLSFVRLRRFFTFTINVEDTLDSKPTFPRDWLRTSIKEDAAIGSFVIDVNTTLDDKVSSYVFYRLMHNQSSINSYHFLVEPDTGIIRSQTQLDRETTSNYTLVVEARDLRGTNENRATTHVIIDVLDVNDNDPVFISQTYTFSPMETSSVGDVIGQIQARDADKDENAAILYGISDGNQNGYFGINASDGRLFVAKTLDFESKSTFTLKVRAYDKQKASTGRQKREVSSPSYSEATVTVQIQDENDNPPVFTQRVFLGSFYPETPEDTVLVTVKAIDKDSGRNSIVLFYTTNQSLPGVLSLNPLTGHVTHNKSVLNATITSYSLHVSARDNNGITPYNTAKNLATVMILYLTSNNAITLSIGVPLSFVNANRQQLEDLLSNVTGQRVILKSLQKSLDDPLQTVAVIHLVSNNSMTVINRNEAIKILSDKSGELETRYPEWKIRVDTVDSPRTSAARRDAYFSFYIAAIMVFAVLIGIVGLMGLIVTCRYKQREKKYHDPDCQIIAMNGTETDWYSLNIPRIGAYIESRADHLGKTRYNAVQDSKLDNQSTNEETDGTAQGGAINSALASEHLETEEPTITSVLDDSLYEARESAREENGSRGQSSSPGNPGNTLNENQPIHELRDVILEENDQASTGAFLNNAFNESEDGSPTNHNSQSETPNSAPNITFVTRKPFSRINITGYSPNVMGSQDDSLVVGGYRGLNGRPLKKRSDSYSPADYPTKNIRLRSENGPAKGINFPGRSSVSISGIYDVQKRREQQRKKKKKRSSHVRFNLEDSQHPDELEWERQVTGTRNMSGDLEGLDEGDWSDAAEPLGFYTFGRKKNESKTDDSPDSNISDSDDCEVLNLDDSFGDSTAYPPSDDENTTTYVINPDRKTQTEAYPVTQL